MSQQNLNPATPQQQAPEPNLWEKYKKWFIRIAVILIVAGAGYAAYINRAPLAALIQSPAESHQQEPTTTPPTVAPAELTPSPVDQGEGDPGIPPTPMPMASTERTTELPYNLPPQPYISHPSLYLETGTPTDPYGKSVDDHTKTWTVELLPGTVAVVGGFKVDDLSGGVYKAVKGPTVLTTTVTDGFVAVVKEEWGRKEFCFRLDQVEQFRWAHAHLFPLPEWEACP